MSKEPRIRRQTLLNMGWRTRVDGDGWGPGWGLNGFPSRGSGVRVPFPAPYAKPCSARRSARPAPASEHPLTGLLLFPANPRIRISPEKPVGQAVLPPLGVQDDISLGGLQSGLPAIAGSDIAVAFHRQPNHNIETGRFVQPRPAQEGPILAHGFKFAQPCSKPKSGHRNH